MNSWLARTTILYGWVLAGGFASAQVFQLPTANDALFDQDGGPRFFVGTVSRSWETGAYGCVRTQGRQFHEGLDIRCLERGQNGEPIDPILAVADGEVTYVNRKTALSNYGRYLIVRHQIEGLPVYSLYAHLADIPQEIAPGVVVSRGQMVATMGLTSNTKQRISKERAHLHFELCFRLSDRFSPWFRTRHSKDKDDHGEWNGRNFLGINPVPVFRGQVYQGQRFSLVRVVRSQREFCRVLVRDPDFFWVRHHRPLVDRNPTAEREGISGYELVLNFAGAPFRAIPRAASEIRGKSKYQVVSVNESATRQYPCRRLVERRGGTWQLASGGQRLFDLLTY